MAQAERVAPGKVALALDLVGSSKEVANAMAYVFGNTVVCNDSQAAKSVTFDVGLRSVTLEGDIYEPGGTLSGGSAPSTSGTLIKVQELIEVEEKLQDAKKNLANAEKEDERTRRKREEWKKLSSEIELKEHGMTLLEQQTENSNASMVTRFSTTKLILT